MRAVFQSLDHNHCTLTRDEVIHYADEVQTERETIEYWAPSEGGYVRDVTVNPGTSGRQVCDGLSYQGNTLQWSGKVPLVNLIRAEHRAAKRGY